MGLTCSMLKMSNLSSGSVALDHPVVGLRSLLFLSSHPQSLPFLPSCHPYSLKLPALADSPLPSLLLLHSAPLPSITIPPSIIPPFHSSALQRTKISIPISLLAEVQLVPTQTITHRISPAVTLVLDQNFDH